jgi:hypothetical protein
MGEVTCDFARMHIGSEIFDKWQYYLEAALEGATKYKELFSRWGNTEVKDEAFDEWIEGTARAKWELKAAVRAHHIALRGSPAKCRCDAHV